MTYHVDPQGVATYQGEQSAQQHVCPNCGYCPCCGRRNLTVDPYVPYYPPYTPIWIVPHYTPSMFSGYIGDGPGYTSPTVT